MRGGEVFVDRRMRVCFALQGLVECATSDVLAARQSVNQVTSIRPSLQEHPMIKYFGLTRAYTAYFFMLSNVVSLEMCLYSWNPVVTSETESSRKP